jgi:hypothetical protein
MNKANKGDRMSDVKALKVWDKQGNVVIEHIFHIDYPPIILFPDCFSTDGLEWKLEDYKEHLP